MSEPEWPSIIEAYKIIEHKIANRVDGEGWKVYRAGSIIRIDIDANN